MKIKDKLNVYYKASSKIKQKSNYATHQVPSKNKIHTFNKKFSFHPLNKELPYCFATNTSYPDDNIKLTEVLFLDVECIELGFGPNNIPYLIGLAWIENNQLLVKQLFSPEPINESQSLASLDLIWKKFKVLVTYNGKAFDIPLIRHRFNFLRKQYNYQIVTHLDLYHLNKKCYDLPRYRLIDSEKYLLDIIRVNDLPGSQSGQAYFEFLKYKHNFLLRKIIMHNRYDLATLASLYQYFQYDYIEFINALNHENSNFILNSKAKMFRLNSDFLTNPKISNIIANVSNKTGKDYYLLAKSYYNNGKYRKAIIFYLKSYKIGYKHSIILAIKILILNKWHYLLTKRLIEWAILCEEATIQKKLIILKNKLEKI